jgi:DNA-binding NtrC family response regulator
MRSDVLIAEENLTQRIFVREIIGSIGMTSAEVSDAEETERYCGEKKPAACIISESLPGWNRNLIRKIKAISPETKLILAADPNGSILGVIDAISCGAERNYLTKPYISDEVEHIIEKVIR